ncbi:ATP-binding cassette domain-containing protein [Marinibacterium profundimaris]|uniref:ATP-binding cassette domain-containing protein n=1 Tax=Marinibacterium profundimaris TaxID=1679460 RepID=UPI000B526C01|nr:ATP-binding cassette domain-containing protein [Marinibacterium profundimaris]
MSARNRPLWRAIRLLLGASPWAFARGAALAVLVLAFGAALLGLSGWFITATGIAGLAGVGVAFDTFRPAAGIRFFALGRTVSRYGERLLTHDATLRALAALRVALLRRLTQADAATLARTRGESALTRLTSDVDALDGLLLRLLLPGLAAVVTYALTGLLIWAIAGPVVALVLILGTLPLAGLLLRALARRAAAPSEAGEVRLQDLQRSLIDAMRDRTALVLAGRLPARSEALAETDAQARAAQAAQDRAERTAAAGFALLTTGVVAAALVAGALLVQAERLDPARAAIALFVALALAECWPPLQRAMAEMGRMRAAAGRLFDQSTPAEPVPPAPATDGPLLVIDRPGLTLTLNPGEAAALTGPSGAGKTRLLIAIAGLAPGESQGLSLQGRPPEAIAEAELRDMVTLVPQRSALLAGTIRDNLSLAAAENTGDEALWEVLDTVALADTLRARDGLETRLGEGGSGLSGGETRRLTLARAILRRPRLLLLDEPTEGLDAATADRVMSNLRKSLPETAILAALHRGDRHAIFARRIGLSL